MLSYECRRCGGVGLAARGGTPRCTEIGAAPAWQGATREQIGAFVTKKQRRHAGCSANRMQWGFHHGLLGNNRTCPRCGGTGYEPNGEGKR